MSLHGAFGLRSDVFPLRNARQLLCPACGELVRLRLFKSLFYLHLLRRPLRELRADYFAACPRCAAAFTLDPRVGRLAEARRGFAVEPRHLSPCGAGPFSAPRGRESRPPLKGVA